MEAERQLQSIYLAGFELQTFDRYPNAVGVVRGNCIALVQVAENRLRMLGTPGWRMGDVLGVLTERDGQAVFQAKSEIIPATAERLAELSQFRCCNPASRF